MLSDRSIDLNFATSGLFSERARTPWHSGDKLRTDGGLDLRASPWYFAQSNYAGSSEIRSFYDIDNRVLRFGPPAGLALLQFGR
jgi:hypothetical protein